MRINKIFVTLSLIAALLAFGGEARTQGSHPTPVLIRAGTMVDTDTGVTLYDQEILVRGWKIEAVGPDLEVPEGAEVIDLSDVVVLPGLFDTHTHLCANVRLQIRNFHELLLQFTGYSLLEPSAYRALQGAANARSMLHAGFTTVRDLGNAGDYADAALSRAIDDGLVEGPKVYYSGKIIAPFGGQMILNPEDDPPEPKDYFFADSQDEMRRAIRRNIDAGADWIKLVVDDKDYSYSEEDMRFIVDEAHRAGKRVAAHCMSDRATRAAAAAGVDSIEHAPFAKQETLQLMKDNEVYLVGTEMSREVLGALQAQGFYPQFVDRLSRAYEMGVPMAFGSDIFVDVAGTDRAELALSTIESWIEAEVPGDALLRAMTIDAARMLGIAGTRGNLRPGMGADIIAVPRNPIADPTALYEVSFVMRDGRVVRHEPPETAKPSNTTEETAQTSNPRETNRGGSR